MVSHMTGFEGFVAHRLDANGVGIHVLVGGSGPPLLLLHGYPQSHLVWHRVAADLARHHTLVLTDLRGYGASDKPPGLDDHSGYSKRAMARDQVEVMRQVGFSRFALCGHDRGGRVAHRLVMDHPGVVTKLMLLDVSPTLAMYEQTSMAFARSYWWWFWLIQPAPFPEAMVAAAPDTFLRKKIGWGHAGLTSYVSDPATMHAMCEDYRAAASIDLGHDRDDRSVGRMVDCPLRVLWGELGTVHRCFRPLDDWRQVASDVTGRTLPCGHYIPEELPRELFEDMRQYFR
jgi:haloacetate dehalogenase